MSYAFPAAVMANTFSVTGLMVVLGLSGNPEMAADFGIVHGAAIALFYSFSANARNILLNRQSAISPGLILGTRLLLFLPLALISLWLSVHFGRVEALLAAVLVMRLCSEWIAELALGSAEVRQDLPYAKRFLALQTAAFVVVGGWLIAGLPHAMPILFAWAVSPLVIPSKLIEGKTCLPMPVPGGWLRLLPHFGSTAVIGVSVYVFRLLILLLVGKTVAGELYTAFAIGGILGSVFAQAIGPSLILREARVGHSAFPSWMKFLLAGAAVAGLVILTIAVLTPASLASAGKSALFWQATGASLVGGCLMVIAQGFRLRLLQNHAHRDTFGPDVLANILLVAAVPYVFYLLGKDALGLLYLLGAVLALLFYSSAIKLAPHDHSSPMQMQSRWIPPVIVISLLLPLFFQINGAVFRDIAFIFDTEGQLSRLPIPLSVLACYGAVLLIGGYSRARLSLTGLFLTFVLMLITSVLLSHVHPGHEQAKLILLIQFVLPMFALVLGQMYLTNLHDISFVARCFLGVIAVLIPVQLAATWAQNHLLLTPYLYLFSIYQHLQYVPMIMVAAFLIALYALWETRFCRALLLGIAVPMGVYAGASVSALATACLIAGVCVFPVLLWRQRRKAGTAILLGIVVTASAAAYFSLAAGKLDGKYGLIRLHTDSSLFAPKNLAERIRYWTFYSEEILSSAKTAALGHVAPPDRKKIPSAHNYYLDFAYNFGILPLLPLLAMLGLTVAGILRQWRSILGSAPYTCLAAIVLFLLIVDNSFKVGMRQPYPGIMTFFLWGLLLSRLFPERQGNRET
jgi:O-antigen ligase